MEAESADEVGGPQLLGSGSASGGRFVGAINHDHYLKFREVNLGHVNQLKLNVSSAGTGGSIEIRQGQKDGPLLASTEVRVNGEWEKWYELTVDLPETSGEADAQTPKDLFVVFTNPQKAGGLMNLDSIYFGLKN